MCGEMFPLAGWQNVRGIATGKQLLHLLSILGWTWFYNVPSSW